MIFYREILSHKYMLGKFVVPFDTFRNHATEKRHIDMWERRQNPQINMPGQLVKLALNKRDTARATFLIKTREWKLD